MGRSRRHSQAQITKKLQACEADIAAGKTIAEVCQALGISKQTFYRWRGQQRTSKSSDAERLRSLEDENTRLRRIVADQALIIQQLQDRQRMTKR
jgi:putative transposase